jgi:hypothetical protein
VEKLILHYLVSKVEPQLSVASVALRSVAVDRLLVHLWTSFITSDNYIEHTHP